jgi:hypothetical protein
MRAVIAEITTENLELEKTEVGRFIPSNGEDEGGNDCRRNAH